MTRPWSYWLPEVLPHVRGCPAIVAENEIRNAARGFFEGSRAWSTLTGLVPVAAGQAEVSLSLPVGQEAVRLGVAWLDGRRLDAALVEELDDMAGDRWLEQVGTVSHVTAIGPSTIRLYRIPDQAAQYGLQVRLWVQPSETADGIPDELAARWRDAIITGARARLMAQKGAPWFDPQMAGVYAQGFQSLIDRANIHVNVRGEGRARRPTRAVWF